MATAQQADERSTDGLSVFLSYTHFDDGHHNGWITSFKQVLERELRAQTGREITIFQDREGIAWGEPWQKRLDLEIDSASFLIPLVTPHYLRSRACLDELRAFAAHEERLGREDRILTVYLITCAELEGRQAALDPLIALLRARQFMDVRELRHNGARSAKLRRRIAELALQFVRAVSRSEGSQVRALSVPRAGSEPAPSPAPAANEDELLEALVSPDPLIAFPAAEMLKARPECLPRVLGVAPAGPVTLAAVRRVVRAMPEASARLLLTQLKNTDAFAAFAASRGVALLFDPAHAPYVEEPLLRGLRAPSLEERQLCIEALGRSARKDVSYELYEQLAAHEADVRRIGPSIAGALVRIFVRSGLDKFAPLHPTCRYLQRAVAAAAGDSSSIANHLELRSLLRGCDGRHADALIAELLSSDHPAPVQLAADALGDGRIRRAVPYLMAVAERRALVEPVEAVARACSIALGQVATPDALSWLCARAEGSPERYGIRFCLHQIRDTQAFLAEARALASSPDPLNFLIWRAAGLLRAEEAIGELKTALECGDPVERGTAAIALAALGRTDVATLLPLWEQSSSTVERVLTALAILRLSPTKYPLLQSRLRLDLAEESSHYWSMLQADILDTLTSTGRPDAVELANVWRPLYRGPGV